MASPSILTGRTDCGVRHWLIKPLLPEGQEYWTMPNLPAGRPQSAMSCGAVQGSGTPLEPPPPFTTSSLQQAASARLNMNPGKTMSVAQALFEQGHISYMRTDSPNLSDEAVAAIRSYATAQQWPLVETPRHWQAKQSAQEAHEAIRPTHVERREAGSTSEERALYQLIWQRAVASQMAAAVYDVRQALSIRWNLWMSGFCVLALKARSSALAGWLLLTEGDATDEMKPRTAITLSRCWMSDNGSPLRMAV
jgi:DNA topoisomerase-1